MTTPDPTPVDGVAVAIAALQTTPAVLALFYPWTAGVDDPLRVGGDNRMPFPRIRVEPSSETIDLRIFQSQHDVRVSFYGNREGDPSDDQIRAALLVCLMVLRGLEYKTYGPGEPVVYWVEQYLPIQPLPEPSGRPRWQFGVRLHMHPSAVSQPA